MWRENLRMEKNIFVKYTTFRREKMGKIYFYLRMHAKPSFAHRLQTAKMASSRTSAQNNGPRAQKMALGRKIIALG